MENKYLINVKKVDGSVVSFRSHRGASSLLEELNSFNEFVQLGNQLERVKNVESVTVEELRQPEDSEEGVNNLGKRVHVTRLDGYKVDFYATLDTHWRSPSEYYALVDCSNPEYEDFGVCRENTDGFEEIDSYTVVNDKFVGKKVHVTMLDSSPVDFYATLGHEKQSTHVYVLKDCSNPLYNHFRVFKKDNDGYLDCDSYTFVE